MQIAKQFSKFGGKCLVGPNSHANSVSNRPKCTEGTVDCELSARAGPQFFPILFIINYVYLCQEYLFTNNSKKGKRGRREGSKIIEKEDAQN